MEYITVSTIRNEEEYIDRCVESVMNQSIPPSLYVVADDGSTNGTLRKLTHHSFKYKCMDILSLDVDRFQVGGWNQIYAFNRGVQVGTKYVDWDYVLKVDADSLLPYYYVSFLIKRMKEDPSLGICAGQPSGEKIRLSRATDAARLIRRECWEEIGGYDFLIAGDSHALLKAQQAGWKVRTFKDLKFMELRPSKKYTMLRWMLTGVERRQFYLPFYHTFLAALKNVAWGHPPIINSLVTMLSHLLYVPRKHAPFLDKEWVRRFAIHEIREFMGELFN